MIKRNVNSIRVQKKIERKKERLKRYLFIKQIEIQNGECKKK